MLRDGDGESPRTSLNNYTHTVRRELGVFCFACAISPSGASITREESRAGIPRTARTPFAGPVAFFSRSDV